MGPIRIGVIGVQNRGACFVCEFHHNVLGAAAHQSLRSGGKLIQVSRPEV